MEIPFVPSISSIVWSLRGRNGHYPCDPEELDFQEDTEDKKKVWIDYGGTEASWILDKGITVENFKVIREIQADLYERGHMMKMATEYQFDIPRYDYMELNPLTRLLMIIFDKMRREITLKNRLSKTKGDNAASMSSEYSKLMEENNNYADYIDSLRVHYA